ncbi:MAG TPA: hypothetical protein VFH43_00020 [Candidatus Kapabacteria bacterium]|nr:hypothetical protein [Candidatus Kapabacteria bacterium]
MAGKGALPSTGVSDGPPPAVRVRITAGPEVGFIGRIGYLFENTDDLQQYIITVTANSDVRRLHLKEGYQYQVEEI